MRHKPLLAISILILALILALLLAASLGTVSIPMSDIASITLKRAFGISIGAQWSDTQETIVWQLRLPRVFGAALVGAALATAGVLFQGLLRNPMADPYLLGTSGGAALAATLALLLPFSVGMFGFTLVPLAAFGGALASVLLVYQIARVGPRTPITTLLLAGFAASAMMASVMSFLMLMNQNTLQRVVLWTMGGISASGWDTLKVVSPLVGAGVLAALALANDLNAFLLGEEQAAALGVAVERQKFLVMAIGALLTGTAVAISGLVGFVGLIVPHIVRLVLGPEHRLLLPASALSGAIFLVLADLVARMVLAPSEVPLGVVTAFIGAPFFIYLLRRTKRDYTF
ncbi:MAG: iron chelate uptake ABC transporter family permease subunit [Chloroflexota bacterium]|nr:iron chelate uptake ABC transporter family permease subunit [Chloroflexota bacterium]